MPGVCDLVHTNEPDAVQLSVAVGSVQVTTAEQLPASFDCVIFDGHPANTGFSVSFTVTSKLQVAVFPLASVASKVLVVVPIGNTLPLGKPAV